MKHTKQIILSALLILSLVLQPIASLAAYSKLEKGMEGAEVLNMQRALQSLGYSLTADGKYGAGTAAAVKKFQRTHGLSTDGVAGDKTLTALYSLVPAFAPGAAAAQPTAVPGYQYVTAQPSSVLSAVVHTTGGSLNLRQGASSGARVVATIPNGDMVIVASRGSKWCSVIYNGMAGYVMTEYLSFSDQTPVSNPPTASPAPQPTAAPVSANMQAMVMTTGGSLNLRDMPGTAGRVIATLPYGAWVTVTSQGSEWCAVSYGGLYGYVMTKYLSFGAAVPTQQWIALPTLAPTILPAPFPTYASPSVQGETAYVSTTGGSLNLRQSANSSARVLTTIPNGTQITVTNRGPVWCAVYYVGQTGFVMTSFLRFLTNVPTALPTASPTTAAPVQGTIVAFVNTTGGSLNLREVPQSSAHVITTIPNGTQLTLTSRGSVWCGAVYQGIQGYVMTAYLRFPTDYATYTPTSAPAITSTPSVNTAIGSALVTTSGGTLNLRSEASSGARVVLLIPNASSVTVYSRGAEWSEIAYNGTRGFVMTRYLTFLGTSAPKADTEEDDPTAFTRVLKKGMAGSDVSWVQSRLSELGYTVTVTNLYDDATFNAVKNFQSKNGLEADGLAGSQTFVLLKSDSARRADSSPLTYTTVRIDQTGSDVTKIQTDLKALGYNVKISGTYDTDTHNAVVAFQQRNGLVISGIADGLTRQLLHSVQGKPYSTPVETLPANEGRIQGPAVSDLKLLHWQNDIKPSVRAGQTFTVFDPNTNLSWKLVFYSLGRHADSQPASWRDTQIMNRSFGDTSWTIHPVYVQLPSGQWTMATMHNRPHLYGSITDNGFGGHLCVHFLRDMAEAQKNDPNYGVNNQVTLRNAWKTITGQTVN